MANRSQVNDRGGWKLPYRRLLGMRRDTYDRILGVPAENGLRTLPSRAEQAEQAKQREARTSREAE